MKWFDNPRKRRKARKSHRRKRRAPKGGWKKYMAKLRRMKGRKHRKSGGTMARRKRRRRASNRRRHRVRGHITRRHVRVRAHLSNPRRRRRHYRRNPGGRGFSVRGVMSRVQSGAVDGIWVVGGKAVTNAIPSLIGLAPTGALGLAVKALSAVVAGYLFGMISGNAGKLATAAGFASIYEPFLKGLPIIGPALSADDDYSAYPLYGAYPNEALAPGVGSYPEVGVGDEDAAYAGQY